MQINLLVVQSVAWGGMECQTVGLGNVLVRRGHRVRIVEVGHRTFSESGRQFGEIGLVHVDPPKPVREMGIGDWRRLFRTVPADVLVHAKGAPNVGNLSLDLAARLSFHLCLNVEHSHMPLPPKQSRRHFGGLVPGLGLWWYRRRVAIFLRSLALHRIVCVSHSLLHHLHDDYLFPRRRMEAIFNGIDTRQFHPDDERRLKARRAWGIPAGTLAIGTVGRLYFAKGQHILIDLFARLRKSLPEKDMRLIFVGIGPEEKSLKARADQFGVADQTLFAGFSDRPWEAYCGLDLFLLPSVIEAFGMALAEAMASGTLVVCNDCGGMPEIVSSPDLGWVVPMNDLEALHAAVLAALRVPEAERAERQAFARQHVVQCFDSAAQFGRLADLIETLAGHRR